MNLRVILLERMSKLKTGCFDTPKMFPQETLGPWLALGHFDAIYTYGLGTEQNIFSAFGDSSSQVSMYNDDRRYFHPLHLISERDDTLFWDTPSWYLSIARIHLSQDAGPISEIVGKLGSKSKTLGLFSQIYYTVELSDIVLVLKADRLNPLLDFDLTLRQFPEIGKVYTYTGIDFGKLKNPLLEPPKEHIPFFYAFFRQRFLHGGPCFGHDQIDHVRRRRGTFG